MQGKSSWGSKLSCSSHYWVSCGDIVLTALWSKFLTNNNFMSLHMWRNTRGYSLTWRNTVSLALSLWQAFNGKQSLNSIQYLVSVGRYINTIYATSVFIFFIDFINGMHIQYSSVSTFIRLNVSIRYRMILALPTAFRE